MQHSQEICLLTIYQVFSKNRLRFFVIPFLNLRVKIVWSWRAQPLRKDGVGRLRPYDCTAFIFLQFSL